MSKEAGNDTFVIEPLVGTLLVKFNTAAVGISVKVVPLTLAYTRIDPFLLPVELLIDAQSKDNVPALTPVKSIKKSIAADEVLSVAPVDNNTIDCTGVAWSVPR